MGEQSVPLQQVLAFRQHLTAQQRNARLAGASDCFTLLTLILADLDHQFGLTPALKEPPHEPR